MLNKSDAFCEKLNLKTSTRQVQTRHAYNASHRIQNG
jgi:hypothetical protein